MACVHRSTFEGGRQHGEHMLHARSTKRNRAVQKLSEVPGEQELLVWSYGDYGK